MANVVTRIRSFLDEVVVELKKATWPTRKELVDSTIVVIITVLMLGLFVSFFDLIFVRLIGLFLG
jgi:preprotein translocase subunit SecE